MISQRQAQLQKFSTFNTTKQKASARDVKLFEYCFDDRFWVAVQQ